MNQSKNLNQKKSKNNSQKGEDILSSPSNLVPENNLPSQSSKLQRKCVACGGIFDRKDLIRIMADSKSKELIINPDNKTFGRSAYICPKAECIKTAEKKKRFVRALKVKIDENLIEKLKMMIN